MLQREVFVRRNYCCCQCTVWDMSKYWVFFGPYFPACRLNMERYEVLSVFSLNGGKYGPEKTPYLDIICAVMILAHIRENDCPEINHSASEINEKDKKSAFDISAKILMFQISNFLNFFLWSQAKETFPLLLENKSCWPSPLAALKKRRI